MFHWRSGSSARPLTRLRYADEWVGALVLLAVVVLVVAIVEAGFLKNWLTPPARLRIILPENGVAGLAVGDDVETMGIRAGSIRRIRLNDNGAMYAIAEIDPDLRQFVRRDSTAVIRRRFVVAGASYIELSRGKGEAMDWEYAALNASVEPNPADMITATVADIRNQTLPILANANHMMAQLDTTVTEIHAGKGNIGQLLEDDHLIRQAEQMVATLDATVAKLQPIETQVSGVLTKADGTMGNLRAASADLKKASPKIPGMTADLARTAAELPPMITEARALSQSLRSLSDQLRGLWLLGGGGQPHQPATRLPPDRVQP
ncbi:ABC transporter periplasmic protein [Ameyamaea chiangmaiensis NBRC 103196]|uniref:MCE family protein n=1 Tax=Ameyamaea chiangmaiensis TaxID=442969 RepID=A0A850PBT7_9PROT|nr:MlaD family protein [Ameyamaea chiangmaiensis]MBS4074847.1 MCE family protein [Ameyamaea chiangmaiensis]NVN41564.1 MCE family protein [Ameyamaea chiangmaiensis]GBQ62962.1 ABC transporter periplasmic protein [Ameyamaea chiangmaiensis NBRC 103196]